MRSERRERSALYFRGLKSCRLLSLFKISGEDVCVRRDTKLPLVLEGQLYVSTVITLVVMAIFISIHCIVHSKKS